MSDKTAMLDINQLAFEGFDACLPDEVIGSVLVAVSGGSDSMALLLLAKAFFKTKFPDCCLIAVTVDHKLRAESAVEASAVAAFCEGLGIQHYTLCWEGEKPASGIASAARDARYDLLVQCALMHGAHIILTGHTADDQVETYLMRSQRSVSGAGRGLAAMATQTLLQNRILLCRPLLKIWREALRDILREVSVSWFDDPSNDNLAYERPRMRLLAKQVDKFEILAAADLAALHRRADNHCVALLLCQAASQIRLLTGDLLFLPKGWARSNPDIMPLTLAYLLAGIGGASFLPPLKECDALTEWLLVDTAPQKRRVTLHHCVIEKSAEGVKIWRERRNLSVMEIQVGESIFWDGRFHITNSATFAVTIGAANTKQLYGYLQQYQIDISKTQQDALSSSPAIFQDGMLAEIPALFALVPQRLPITTRRRFACFDRVLSGHDFEVVQVVKELLTMLLNHK